MATVGTGFFTPVDEMPLRLLREVKPEEEAKAQTREQHLVDIINRKIEASSCESLSHGERE